MGRVVVVKGQQVFGVLKEVPVGQQLVVPPQQFRHADVIAHPTPHALQHVVEGGNVGQLPQVG